MWEWRLRGPPVFPKFTQLIGNSNWPLPRTPPTPVALSWETHLSPKNLSPFLPVILKNKRKSRVKDLMRPLVLRRQRKTWSRLNKSAANLITKTGFCCSWNHRAERDSLIAARRAWEGTWGLLYFSGQGTLQLAGCWHRLASCLNHLLKSRRNIKARKLVPAIPSKNFNWSWEVTGASLGVIKIDS